MAIVAGIDGCPAGWLCLTKDTSSGVVQAQILASIDQLLGLDPRPHIVMVDIPIGLTTAGPRQCDIAARSLLRAPRASSVFPSPIRPMLVATTHAEACQIGVAADGRKLSRQAWAILPKIREVDAFVRSDPTRNRWVREVHPEVCFFAWNGFVAMANRKKTLAGRIERESLAGRGRSCFSGRRSLDHQAVMIAEGHVACRASAAMSRSSADMNRSK